MIDEMYPDRSTVQVLHAMKKASIESGARSRWGDENVALIDRAVERTIVIVNRLNPLAPLEQVSMREPVAVTVTPDGVRANLSVGGGAITLVRQVTRAVRDEIRVDEDGTESTPPLRLTPDDSIDDGRGSSGQSPRL